MAVKPQGLSGVALYAEISPGVFEPTGLLLSDGDGGALVKENGIIGGGKNEHSLDNNHTVVHHKLDIIPVPAAQTNLDILAGAPAYLGGAFCTGASGAVTIKNGGVTIYSGTPAEGPIDFGCNGAELNCDLGIVITTAAATTVNVYARGQ